MTCIVQKFGGTSVATLERINNVADIVAKSKAKGTDIIVVVSAMAGVTNKFVEYVQNLNASEGDPEYDQVVSSGESVTAGLLAIALKNRGLNARSYASWQVPIKTDDRHGRATISDVEVENLQRDLKNGIVPVVCGFQGLSPENRITTFGRGGSDLTAVAVASAVEADLCEIYSDVDGVYTVDPNIYPDAKKLEHVNYGEMLKMAAQGAKVLQEQSVSYAMRKNVIIRVASSFIDGAGTIISGEISSKPFIGLAVTHNLSHIRVAYASAEDLEKIKNLLEFNHIDFSILKQNQCKNKITIVVDKRKDWITVNLLKNSESVVSVKREVARRHLSKISVIGRDCSEKNCIETVEAMKNIKLEVINPSVGDYQTDFLVSSSQLTEAISFLHQYCGLDK